MNTSTSPDRPVLSVERLTIDFGPRRVVDELSFALQRGRTLCIAGESGSGKSLTSPSVVGLLPRPARVPGGAIICEGRAQLGLPERAQAPDRQRGERLSV
ncbi:ABC transporter ATP-binding protein, partial [Pseudomonas aeruginosa]